LEISPSNHWMACSEDYVSRRQYQIRVRNLQTGDWLPDLVENTSGDVVWSADSAGFFYVRLDSETLLPYQVYYHTLGAEPHKTGWCMKRPTTPIICTSATAVPKNIC
jgi:Protease II